MQKTRGPNSPKFTQEGPNFDKKIIHSPYSIFRVKNLSGRSGRTCFFSQPGSSSAIRGLRYRWSHFSNRTLTEVLDQVDRSDRRVAADERDDHADQNVVDPLLPVQRVCPLGVGQRLGELGIGHWTGGIMNNIAKGVEATGFEGWVNYIGYLTYGFEPLLPL